MHLPIADASLCQAAQRSLESYHRRIAHRVQAQLIQGLEPFAPEPEAWLSDPHRVAPHCLATTAQEVSAMNALHALPTSPEFDTEQSHWQRIEDIYQDDTLFRFSSDSFDRPVIVQAFASEASQLKLVEAWLRSHLWTTYQLALMVPRTEACPPAALLRLLSHYPAARPHFAWLPLSQSAALECLSILPDFVTTQEPHIYMAHDLERDDPMALRALQSGWITCTPERHALASLLPAHTVPVQLQNWLSTANSLTQHLFHPDADWETRQQFVRQAQQAAQALRPDLIRLHSQPLRRGA